VLDRARTSRRCGAPEGEQPDEPGALRRGAQLWRGSEALTFLDLLDNEEEDPAKGAIMRKTG
jgi:hypothetical protein